MYRVPEQPSLSINEQPPGFNQQNFDGKIFNSVSHQSYYTSQGVISNYQRDLQTIPTPQSNHPSQTQTNYLNQVVQYQNNQHSFDLEERSKSIDSIQVAFMS